MNEKRAGLLTRTWRRREYNAANHCGARLRGSNHGGSILGSVPAAAVDTKDVPTLTPVVSMNEYSIISHASEHEAFRDSM